MGKRPKRQQTDCLLKKHEMPTPEQLWDSLGLDTLLASDNPLAAVSDHVDEVIERRRELNGKLFESSMHAAKAELERARWRLELRDIHEAQLARSKHELQQHEQEVARLTSSITKLQELLEQTLPDLAALEQNVLVDREQWRDYFENGDETILILKREQHPAVA